MLISLYGPIIIIDIVGLFENYYFWNSKIVVRLFEDYYF